MPLRTLTHLTSQPPTKEYSTPSPTLTNPHPTSASAHLHSFSRVCAHILQRPLQEAGQLRDGHLVGKATLDQKQQRHLGGGGKGGQLEAAKPPEEGGRGGAAAAPGGLGWVGLGWVGVGGADRGSSSTWGEGGSGSSRLDPTIHHKLRHLRSYTTHPSHSPVVPASK